MAANEADLKTDGRATFAYAWPRYANLLLGTWLFISAFAWPHSWSSSAAAWIMGSCITITAFAAIWAEPARYFNVLLGAISLGWQVSASRYEPVSLVNGFIVSGLVVVLATVPSGLWRARLSPRHS